jgi:alpha-methylacyl-CoA racemase
MLAAATFRIGDGPSPRSARHRLCSAVVTDSPSDHASAGPLSGVRIVEVAGIGPGPFAAMMLADMGAEVLRIERRVPAAADAGILDGILRRNRSAVAVLDLKAEGGVEALLRIVERADALLEGFRPGVAERLGFGPDVCLARNPRLVYGRITGWGQDGPLARSAGHDIDYIALSGVLHAIGRPGVPPVPPINLVADFGGGGMLVAYGMVCALLEASRSGRGQVVDAAMVDGCASLMAMTMMLRHLGMWNDQRGTNLLDGGAPFYDTYETADGRYIAVGAIEPQFYAELLERCGLDAEELPGQHDRAAWPAMKERFAALFRTRTRDEWCALLEGTDACVSPVLSLGEAQQHPHNVHRGTFVEAFGMPQPAPAPRFSRTPGTLRSGPLRPSENGVAELERWGLGGDEVARLRSEGVLG